MVVRQSLGTEVTGSNPVVYSQQNAKDCLGKQRKVLKTSPLGEWSNWKLARRKVLFRMRTFGLSGSLTEVKLRRRKDGRVVVYDIGNATYSKTQHWLIHA